jgi:hypothetical protein
MPAHPPTTSSDETNPLPTGSRPLSNRTVLKTDPDSEEAITDDDDDDDDDAAPLPDEPTARQILKARGAI